MSAKKTADPKKNAKGKSGGSQPGKPAEPKDAILPPLLQMGFSMASFLIVAVPLVVALVSYLSNVAVMDILLRVAVTIAGLGVLLCILLRMLNHGILKSSQEQIVDALEQQKAAASHEIRA